MSAPCCSAQLRLLWQKPQTFSYGAAKRRFSLCSAKQHKKSSNKENHDIDNLLYRLDSQKRAPPTSVSKKVRGQVTPAVVSAENGYSGVPVNHHSDLSFKQLLHQRYNEASRSVVIRTQNPESTIQSLVSFGGLKHVQFTSHDKGYILAEFANENSITKIQLSASFFNEANQFPMQTRILFDSSTHGHKKRTPVPQISEGNWQEKFSKIYPEKNTLDQELQELCARRSLGDNDLRSRFFVCLQLEELLKSFLPEVHIIPYGSCLNGFGWWNSDLDMMLCFNKELYGTKIIRSPVNNGQATNLKILTEIFSSSRHLAQRTLEMVASLLELAPRTNNVFKILNARVPIIRFKNMAVNLNCDISIQAMDSIKMTELLYLYSVSEQRLKPLMAGIKQWATSHHLTSGGEQQKTTTIGFLMLLIFYLQTRSPPVLPTLRKLQSLASTTEMFYIENIVYGLPSNPCSIPRSQNKESIESLLHGFFTFYSEFDFKNKAISIIEGATFNKPQNSTPVHIENPLCIGLNICRNVGNSHLDLLTSAMKEAALKLEEMADQPRNDLPNLPSLMSNKGPKSRLSVLFSTSSSQAVEHTTSVDLSELFVDNDLTQAENTENNATETSNQFDQNGAELTEDTAAYIAESNPPSHRMIVPDTIQNIQSSLEFQEFNELGTQGSGIDKYHKAASGVGKTSSGGNTAAKKTR